MEWVLVNNGAREGFETRDAVLERLRELLEDYLAASPLADAEVYDPFEREHEIEVGLRLHVTEE